MYKKSIIPITMALVEELKEKLLALLIYNEAEFKQQVQALFEEG